MTNTRIETLKSHAKSKFWRDMDFYTTTKPTFHETNHCKQNTPNG
jgi:hypothetical protein